MFRYSQRCLVVEIKQEKAYMKINIQSIIKSDLYSYNTNNTNIACGYKA